MLKETLIVAVRVIGILFTVFCVMHSSTSVAADFYQDFRGSDFNIATLYAIGPDSGLEPTDEGLKIKSGNGSDNIGVGYPLPLGGDFVVEADVVLLDVPTPSSGYGTGVAILLEDKVNQGASLQFVRSPEGNLMFVAHHYVVDDSGEYTHSAKTFETEDESVTLRLKREGGSLSYEVASGGQDSFRSLDEVSFSKRPIQTVQTYGQAGGGANPFNVLIRDLRLQAEGIGESAMAYDGSSEDWWIAAIAFITIPLVIAAIAWYFRRKK